MNKRLFLGITLVILLGLVLSACNQPFSTASVPTLVVPVLVTATSGAGGTIVTQGQATVGPLTTATPDISPTATKVSASPTVLASATAAVATSVPVTDLTCSLTDGGQFLALQQKGVDWVFDPTKPQVQNGDGAIVDRPDLVGCNFIAEGRQDPSEEIGHLWLIRDSQFGDNTLAHLNNKGLFVCSDCMVQAFPKKWNMGDFSNKKYAPIAGMYITDYRRDMQNSVPTPHDWPIYYHPVKGAVVVYEPGETAGIETHLSCEGKKDPFRVQVTGLVGEESYTATFGGTDCLVAVWLDGKAEYSLLDNQRDNFTWVTKIEVWYFPADWSKSQAEAWAKAHTPAP